MRVEPKMETDLISRGGVPKSGFPLGILGFLLGRPADGHAIPHDNPTLIP